ncbi:DELTA-thalatoxin-Avl1a-like isoform X2 [Carettochelys insculpta]|uniref:DELTA-thalatoxin-Avl1a-like isoform X2 n=1 Tax=Carettochelys insculpta TaxID=44489 RepID=UPI003EB87AE9
MNIEGLLVGVNAGRCVGIEITNCTTDVTLENPRSYCFSGRMIKDPDLLIPPNSSGCCLFVKTSFGARGSVGVLSYESDAFTLVIMFSNPFDRMLYSSEFALEIFTGRKHFEDMERLYQYMYNNGPPFNCASFKKMELTGSHSQLEVTNQEIKVTAIMSNMDKALIKVQVE